MGTRLVIAVFALFIAACGSNKQDACATDKECPAGATCVEAGRCAAATCVTDRECAIGSVCEAATCKPGCRNNLDCPGAAALCDTSAGQPGECIGCRSDGDCPARYSCAAHECVQACRDDVNCDSGHCDAADRVCVECTADKHCGAGKACVDERCVAGCGNDTSCPADRPRCDTDRGDYGACVQCRGAADCAGGATCNADGTCGPPPVMPGPPGYKLDVLIVVDDSASMESKQARLGTALPALIDQLEVRFGRRPDLHIGVTSTSVGAGNHSVTTCPAVNDDGALMAPADCLVDGAYLSDVASGGGRETNYHQSLSATLSCLTNRGADGCGFEQPLRAVRLALDGSRPGNAGFLRPDAALLVLILTDEDDCSASRFALFDIDTTNLGPASSFRCFRDAVRCDPDQPDKVGAKQGCVLRPSAAYVTPVDDFGTFLRTLRPGRVAVEVIGGPPTPVAVEVGATSGELEVAPSCTGVPSTVEADPGLRLAAFASGFGASGSLDSICSDYAPALKRLADRAAVLLNH